MKKHIKVLPLFLSIVIFISCILNSAITVHADSLWDKFDRWATKTGVKIMDVVFFGISQFGAVVEKHDFELFLNNQDAFYELWNRDSSCPVIVNEETNDITLTKEFMTELKALLDEYTKTEQTKEENGGFMLVPTMKMDSVPASFFKDAVQYQSFRGVVSKYGMLCIIARYAGRYNNFVVCDPFENKNTVLVDAGDYLDAYKNDNTAWVNCNFYDCVEWKYLDFELRYCNATTTPNFNLENSTEYPLASTTTFISSISQVWANGNSKEATSNTRLLCSADGRRVRVFVSEDAAINYSVAKRKVYYTKEYYSYVPEDLTVSIDDLQKSVSDLEKVIEDLLKKINNDTSEKEIEELLRQILEEIRKNPGGGGAGSGSGDVTVSVDLKETNYWLSKIYDRLGEILDRIKAKIEASLDEISETLKKIKNWTAVDTVIDGVDAVADWLDLIRDVLTDGAGSAVSSLSSALQDSTDLMKQKFPFSMPWDILFFVTVLSAEPETPHFEIPIDIDMEWADMNIHYDFVIDFSQFQWFSDLCRLILSMTYAAGLMKKTLEIVSANKEA